MSGVPSPTIGEVVDKVSSWTPARDDPDGEFVYVDLSTVDQNSKALATPRRLACTDAPSRARQIIRSGDVLVSTVRPNLNAVGRVPVEMDGATASTGFCVLRPRSEVADSDYLFHWVRSPRFVGEMVRKATGASYPAVSDRIVLESKIPLPILDEQKRIAQILNKADALRVKRRDAFAQLDILTQSIFLDMFGDPATNPKGWPRLSLLTSLESAEVFVDGDWVESKDQDPAGDVRLIQLADVGDGVYLDKSSRFLTSDTARRLRCTLLRAGDILVARMPDPLGRACLFPGDKREAVTVVDICIIRSGSEGPHPTWLMCCINTAGFRSLIAREATGTTRSRISRGNLSRLPIIVPPLALQQVFANRLEAATK